MIHPKRYRIVVRREFGERLAAAFPGVCIRASDGQTVLVASVADEAALYGLLDRLRDFAVELVSLCEITAEENGTGDA